MIKLTHFLPFLLFLVLTGCSSGGSSTPGDTNTTITPTPDTNTTNDVNTTINQTITITENYQVVPLGKGITTNLEVNITDTPKDLYILFSNHSSNTIDTDSIIKHNKAISGTLKSTIRYHKEVSHSITHSTRNWDFLNAIHTQNTVRALSQLPSSKIVLQPRSKDMVGNTENFCVDIQSSSPYTCSATTTATARSVTTANTALGTKTLNIWVSNDSYGSSCSKSSCITQTMVDALAERFLKDGLNNDIYDWDTSIYGEEWGTEQKGYSDLIPEDNTITILLTDIDNDNNTDGGTIGYFYSKDNYTKSVVSGSNERVMFYIDALLFAQKDKSTWEITDYWPAETISTLAHEFVHMIQFYQKDILLLDSTSSGTTEVWIDELLAETTEDLLATRINHIGPRGVDPNDGSAGDTGNDKGRYPLFNQTNTLTLTQSNRNLFLLSNYSHVNAFGAFLTRNYNGAQLLHDMMHNTETDQNAVVYGVQQSTAGSEKTFDDLLKEWGTAVLLSDIKSPTNLPTYNTGDFTPSTYSGNTYQLGSINFFNYSPQPSIYSVIGTVRPQGNFYYKVGENLSGSVIINLKLEANTEATLIAK